MACALLALSGCLPFFSYGPPCVEEEGILLDHVRVEKELLTSVPAAGEGSSKDRRPPWIFEIEPIQGGGVLLTLEDGAARIDLDGAVEQRLSFDPLDWYFPVQVLAPATNGAREEPAFLAVPREDRDALLAFDAAGDLLWRREVDLGTWAWLVPGDLNGDGRSEILVEAYGGKGAYVFSTEGERLALIRSEHYLTAYGMADVNGDGDQEAILYGWPDEDRRGTFEIFDVHWRENEGYWKVERVARWKAVALRDFTVDRSPTGEMGILAIDGDGFLWWSFDGRELARLGAPKASCFRYVFTGELGDGRRIIAVDGSGYVPKHAVYVYDRNGELVFHEIGTGHVRDLYVADPETVLLAVQDELWAYRVGTEAVPTDPSQSSP